MMQNFKSVHVTFQWEFRIFCALLSSGSSAYFLRRCLEETAATAMESSNKWECWKYKCVWNFLAMTSV